MSDSATATLFYGRAILCPSPTHERCDGAGEPRDEYHGALPGTLAYLREDEGRDDGGVSIGTYGFPYGMDTVLHYLCIKASRVEASHCDMTKVDVTAMLYPGAPWAVQIVDFCQKYNIPPADVGDRIGWHIVTWLG